MAKFILVSIMQDAQKQKLTEGQGIKYTRCYILWRKM